jgi:hypothetical protein
MFWQRYRKKSATESIYYCNFELKMQKTKFTDNEVLIKLEEHLDYLNREKGVNPMYMYAYNATDEELEGRPKSPLLNW